MGINDDIIIDQFTNTIIDLEKEIESLRTQLAESIPKSEIERLIWAAIMKLSGSNDYERGKLNALESIRYTLESHTPPHPTTRRINRE